MIYDLFIFFVVSQFVFLIYRKLVEEIFDLDFFTETNTVRIKGKLKPLVTEEAS